MIEYFLFIHQIKQTNQKNQNICVFILFIVCMNMNAMPMMEGTSTGEKEYE